MEQNNDNYTDKDNLTDIVFSEEDKSNKLKNILFGGIIVSVLLVIVFVIISVISTDSTEESSEDIENIEFLEDDDPFFMDTPLDEIGNLSEDEINHIVESESGDSFQEDNFGKKDSIKDTVLSSIQPSPVSRVEPNNTVPESTSLMSVENEHKVEDKQFQKKEPNINRNLNREYFIQTGTFLKFRPNDKFLNSFQNIGLSYILDTYEKNGKNIIRVLVGPFENKVDAKKALIDIKEKIVKDAYILKTRLH